MSRDGRLAARDLLGKLTVVPVELTANCSRKRSANISDQCYKQCPDLPKVA